MSAFVNMRARFLIQRTVRDIWVLPLWGWRGKNKVHSREPGYLRESRV